MSGERDLQASANDLVDLGQDLGFDLSAGTLTPPAVFSPFHMVTTESSAEARPPSSDVVQVSYMGHGSRKVVREVPFAANATVHFYLKKTGTNSIRTHSVLLVNGKRVRTNYVLRKGEHIALQPTRGAMS